jgi:hypothetical protein
MSLLVSDDIKSQAREMYKSGTIKCFAVVDVETAEISKLLYNSSDVYRFMAIHNPKDETKFVSSIVSVADVIDGRCEI